MCIIYESLKFFVKRFKNTKTITTTVRGCDSEMMLKYMIEKNNFTMLKVEQSHLPFQQLMHIDLGEEKGGKWLPFISIAKVMMIYLKIKECKDVNISKFEYN